MARKLREQVQEQRAAREVSARLEALLEELSAQEPYLDYTKASWGRCPQQAGLELEYATVLARMYPGSLREEAVELKGFHRGALGEWQQEHQALSEQHRQVLLALEEGRQRLSQLRAECEKRAGSISDLRKQKEYQRQRYRISAQLSW